jgi:hypothetical protein
MTQFHLPTNKSILIFSNPRTGSYALSELISIQLPNHRLFYEPSYDKKNLNKFFIYHSLNKSYIIKEHTLTFFKNYNHDFLTDDHYVVRIRRKNKINQILSNYIARHRKTWVKFVEDNRQELIPMNDKMLLEDLNWINLYNWETDRLRYPVNLDLYYEDIDFSSITKNKKSSIPCNHEELKNWAFDLLKDKV